MNLDQKHWDKVWQEGDYKRGSTCQRLVPFLKQRIPDGATINDYGSGMGLAELELIKYGHQINMVDITDCALCEETRKKIGSQLTYTLCALESLPKAFPVADWGICINVLMTIDPEKLDSIMKEMRRTCNNLIIEVYDLPDMRLGKDMTTIKGDAEFWFSEMKKYWPKVYSHPSPEHKRRYITIGNS